MIINSQESNTIQTSGSLEAKQAKISMNKLAKLQHMLSTGLYKDPIGSTIVELSNNAIDSIRSSGKDPIKNPTTVKIWSETNQYFIAIEDKGLGLDKETFENVVMSYLESTKEEDEDSIGCYGVGCKSTISLLRPAEWRIRKDGKECKYLVYKGSAFLEYDELYEKDTAEDNGVEIKIKIKDWQERNTFVSKAKQRLAYYDEVALIVDNQIVENKIYRNDLFQWCENSPYNDLHFALKDVVYRIDWNQLGISTIMLPVAIRFNLSCGITPAISREDVHYTESTKKLLLSKIREVADYFVTEWNKNSVKDSFKDAYKQGIKDYDRQVTIENKVFMIDQLVPYSSLIPNHLTVKGLNSKDLYRFNSKTSDLFYEYDQVGYYRHSYSYGKDAVWKKDKIWKDETLTRWLLNKNGRTVIVDQTPIGNIKSFLQDKYGVETMFVKQYKERYLGKKSHLFDDSYTELLQLSKVPRTEWRQHIQEWQLVQKEFTDTFIKEFDIEQSEPYQRWLQQKKEDQKAQRNSPTYVSKSLNKQKGDVTIKYASTYRNRIKWEIFTKPIDSLYKKDKLTVYMLRTEEEPENLYEFRQALRQDIDFIQVNVSEVKHFQNRHNYIHMKELQKSRPFQRLATALYAETILNLEPDNNQIIYETFPKYKRLKAKVQDYIAANSTYNTSTSLKNVIINESKETNNWDQNIYPELVQFRVMVDNFAFLKFLDVRGSDSEGEKVIKNITYVMLKNKLKTGKNIDEFQLVPKSDLCLSTIVEAEFVEHEGELVPF